MKKVIDVVFADIMFLFIDHSDRKFQKWEFKMKIQISNIKEEYTKSMIRF